jgi:hypothetical protein
MFQTKVVLKIKTHFFFCLKPFPENLAVYVIMWKDTVEPDRSQNDACALHAG